jgi:aldose sugar dehydrogenase
MRTFHFTRLLSLCAIVLTLSAAARASVVHTELVEGTRIQVFEVARSLDRPWGIAFLPDNSGNALITERSGRIRSVNTKTGIVGPTLTGVPQVYASGQGGLLDIVVSPKFSADNTVFFSYSEPHKDGARTAVARAVVAGQTLREVTVIFRQAQGLDNGYHFGSRLAFARDGTLFITTGDRYTEKDGAQLLTTHFGKVIRINPDGSVPKDNPYAQHATALKEIWSYGHRNLQGAAIHPATGALWTSEHGPRGGDEINTPQAGKNYGWPIVGFGIDYSGQKLHDATARVGMESPVHHWVPSIAACGMNFYTGDKFAAWKGALFVTGLSARTLVMLSLTGDKVTRETRLLNDLGHRLRHVVTGPDGTLYVLTDDANGRLLRIEPAR